MNTTIKQTTLLFPILLVCYEIATYLSNDMYLPALPAMMRDLGLSVKQAQLTLTTWFVGSAVLPLLMGIVADRYGRRPVLLIGGVIYILATIACAMTSTTHVLLIARFIEGAVIPSMMIAGYACIHELYEQKEAIRILALMGSITVLAPALGPLLGSLILLVFNWRGIFWFIAIFSFISIVLLFRFMPETLSLENRHPVNLKVIFGQYGRIIINKRFMLLLLVLGFIFAGFIVWITAGPLLIIEHFHYSPLVFGLIQAVIFFAYIAGSHSVKYLLESVGVKSLIKIGLMTTLVGGVAAFLLAYLFPQNSLPFLIAMTIYSIGSALIFSPLNRLIIESSDEPMGVRVALFTVLWTGFAVLGSLIASVFYNGSILSIGWPLALAIILSCLIMLVTPEKLAS